MLLHQPDRVLEVAVLDFAVAQRALPEGALAVLAAAEAQDDGQGDLALAEIIAHRFAEPGAVARIIQRVVDQLEGDAEVAAVRPERRLLLGRPLGNGGAHLSGRREQGGGLGVDDGEVGILRRGRILGGSQLHHLAFGDDGGG